MAPYNKNIAENSSITPPARRSGSPRKDIIENKNIAEKSSIASLARRPGRPRKNIENSSKNSEDMPVTPNTSTKHPVIVIGSPKNIISENSDNAPITPNTPTKYSLTKNSVKNINASSANNTSTSSTTSATHVTSYNYA